MPQIALTDHAILNLKPPKSGTKWYSHKGDRYRGLQVAVGKTSTTFYLKKRAPSGKIVTKKLGRHPDMSLDAAYQKVVELASAIDNGSPTTTDHEIVTFADAFQWHLTRSRKRPLTENTKEGYRQMYGCHLQAPLGDRRLETITQPEIERLLAKSTPSVQGYCIRIVKASFESARKSGRRDLINPAEFIEPPELESREPITPTEELFKVWDELQGLDSLNLSIWTIGLCTGIRHKSICRLRWTPDSMGNDGHVDFDKRVIVLPRMKNQRSRDIPVSDLVIEILTAQKVQDGIWVFPSPTKHGVPVYRAKKIRDTAMFHDTRRHFTTCGGLCQIESYTLGFLRGDSVGAQSMGGNKAMAGYMGKTANHDMTNRITACVLEMMKAEENDVLQLILRDDADRHELTPKKRSGAGLTV